MRIAIVGSGITGLAAAYILDRSPDHAITLYEADSRLGGHANTVTVEDPTAGPINVDTGFIVHNRRNYPNLLKLFAELDVATQESEMTFGVDDEASGLSYSATSLSSLFAQRRNLARPNLWRMLADIARFYRAGQQLLETADTESEREVPSAKSRPNANYTIGDMLAEGQYSKTFVDLHLVPMGAAVWSTNPERFKKFPAVTLLRFLDNHGLLGWGDKPRWRTVVGGSKTYVDAVADQLSGTVRLNSAVHEVKRTVKGVKVSTGDDSQLYDNVILACHSDQSLKILAEPTGPEQRLLESIKYQPNEATLHTDVSLLPKQRRSWAAWNYRRPANPTASHIGATLTYDMTTLQRLNGEKRYLVSLNSTKNIDPSCILGQYKYAHPVFDTAAVKAQATLDVVNGTDGVYFAGAWQSYGFHEDGIASAVRACSKLGVVW